MGDRRTAGNGNAGSGGQAGEALRISKVERLVDLGDLPGPREFDRVELIHAHEACRERLMPVGPELGHALVPHHLHEEAEQEHGIGIRRHLSHVAPVDDVAPDPNLLPELDDAGLDVGLPGLNESRHKGLLAVPGLDASRFDDDVPGAGVRILPEHDSHGDRLRRNPALPSARSEIEERRLGTPERLALPTPRVHDPCARHVGNSASALRAEVRSCVCGDENFLVRQEDSFGMVAAI